MAFTKLVDMELDDEDKLDFCAPMPCPRPDYPYGLRISLSEKELKKLGIATPQVGDYIDMRAFACVKSVSSDSSDGGETCRVELQIEKIAVENEMTEMADEEKSEPKKRRSRLYGRTAAVLLAIAVALAPAIAFAQSAILQGGGMTLGHVPAYTVTGGQPIVVDGGPARGGSVGTGVSELGLIARGTGTAPYSGQGTGFAGSIFCLYDAPIDNANGYHYLCLSPNATGGNGLISFGNVGAAAATTLDFSINGSTVTPVSCSGTPTSSFAVVNGIVTHC